VWDVIRASSLIIAVDDPDRFESRIGSRIDEVMDLMGGECVVASDTGFEVNCDSVLRVACQKLLDIVRDHAHRTAGALSEERAP
jgi:hypothetical protein